MPKLHIATVPPIGTLLEIEYTDATLIVASEGPLIVPCWWDAPTVDQMRMLLRLSQRRERVLRGPTAFAQFVLDGTPIFGPEVRAIVEKLTHDHYGLGIAHCIELTGLQGAAVRAFLGGLLLIRRGNKPMKVFGNAAEASTWIGTHIAVVEPGWTGPRVLAIRDALVERWSDLNKPR